MHAGKVDSSNRLRLTLIALLEAGLRGLTTAEIHNHTGSMAPGTDISALRANGYDIRCTYEGLINGTRRYRYTLVQESV